jgi:D-alanyl-D-alanine dipeptidase
MPTPIHELSAAAVVFAYPVSSSLTGWQGVALSEGMKESPAAQSLQKYCTDAGLTPLASEWWHFDDLHTSKNITGSTGAYYLMECFSVAPEGE